jgi:hypothetical protein
MLCSIFRGKSTKKRQQQGDDHKMEEMDMVSIKRRCGNGSTTCTWWNLEAKDKNKPSRAWINEYTRGTTQHMMMLEANRYRFHEATSS